MSIKTYARALLALFKNFFNTPLEPLRTEEFIIFFHKKEGMHSPVILHLPTEILLIVDVDARGYTKSKKIEEATKLCAEVSHSDKASLIKPGMFASGLLRKRLLKKVNKDELGEMVTLGDQSYKVVPSTLVISSEEQQEFYAFMRLL